MNSLHLRAEKHRSHRVGWLRAAVLGANDGIVSTASLIVGVAAAHATQESILIAGVAGLVAGAMSMAAGEYVSVSSQVDTEKADLARETAELATNIEAEQHELANIYVKRGVSPELAQQVAKQLMDHDALGAHARDELGIFEALSTSPTQAALASAAAFSIGALLPLSIVLFVSSDILIPAVSISAFVFLAALGALSASIGGANVMIGILRVTFWGALAMVLTAGIGTLLGVAV